MNEMNGTKVGTFLAFGKRILLPNILNISSKKEHKGLSAFLRKEYELQIQVESNLEYYFYKLLTISMDPRSTESQIIRHVNKFTQNL